MKDFEKVNENKDLYEMECLFSHEEIEQKIRELYPNMKQVEINYHVSHLEDCDCLKVATDERDLEEAIREQIEE